MDQATASPTRSQALVYDGRIGELYAVFFLNLLFTILTLGIFRFWAVTRMRRYLWSRMRFQGERFEYTGTGGELFGGFLLAGLILIGAFVVAFLVSMALSRISSSLVMLPYIVLYGLVFVLAAGAVFSAQRYRLSRTSWRGIRGGMVGSMLAYGLRSVCYFILEVVTLFQTVPWVSVRLTERRINASNFGSAKFSFRGRAATLYLPYLATLLGLVAAYVIFFGGIGLLLLQVFPGVLFSIMYVLQRPNAVSNDPDAAGALASIGTLAVASYAVLIIVAYLITSWYRALFERHVVGNTALGALRFSSSMSGPALCGLVLGNIAITIVTLGFGMPLVLHRNARFLARTLWTNGTLDTATMAQATQAAPRFGEGMFQQLDGGGVL